MLHRPTRFVSLRPFSGAASRSSAALCAAFVLAFVTAVSASSAACRARLTAADLVKLTVRGTDPGSACRVAEAEARLPRSGADAAQWGIDGLLNRGWGARRSPHSRGVGVVEAVRVELGEDALAESARGDSEGHS
jgi:hypothetical protein